MNVLDFPEGQHLKAVDASPMVRVYPEGRKFTIGKLPEEQRLTAADHGADIPITTSIQIRFPFSWIQEPL